MIAALYVEKDGAYAGLPGVDHFGLPKPGRYGDWMKQGLFWICRVEQGFYGHLSRKPTWLLANLWHCRPPELRWGRGAQRLHPIALERHGYEKARRIGMMAMVGGKDKTRIRNATTPKFRDLLIAESVPRARER